MYRSRKYTVKQSKPYILGMSTNILFKSSYLKMMLVLSSLYVKNPYLFRIVDELLKSFSTQKWMLNFSKRIFMVFNINLTTFPSIGDKYDFMRGFEFSVNKNFRDSNYELSSMIILLLLSMWWNSIMVKIESAFIYNSRI